jgi:hypothetical protein
MNCTSPCELTSRSIQLLYAILWAASESLRNGQTTEVPGHLAAVEGLKLAFSLSIYTWQRRRARNETYQGLEQDEGQNLQDLSEGDQEAIASPVTYSSSTFIPGTIKSTIYVGIIAVLFSICRYFVRFTLSSYPELLAHIIFQVSAERQLVDPFALYLSIPIATFCSLIALHFAFSRTFTLLQWQAVLLQVGIKYLCQNT